VVPGSDVGRRAVVRDRGQVSITQMLHEEKAA